jgi:hypothetical protein
MAPQSGTLLSFLLALVVLPSGVLAEPSPPQPRADSLRQSQDLLRRFPFAPNCNGNTQEMVACLWERRNREDRVLGALLGETERLEQWRASRRRVCEVVAQKGVGGSIHPILWLSCENGLNRELLRLLKQPLLQKPGL